MQVSNVDKDTVPQSIYKEYLNHPLSLTLSTPGLVFFLVSTEDKILYLAKLISKDFG